MLQSSFLSDLEKYCDARELAYYISLRDHNVTDAFENIKKASKISDTHDIFVEDYLDLNPSFSKLKHLYSALMKAGTKWDVKMAERIEIFLKGMYISIKWRYCV